MIFSSVDAVAQNIFYGRLFRFNFILILYVNIHECIPYLENKGMPGTVVYCVQLSSPLLYKRRETCRNIGN